jgi:hypothetical protein
MSYLGFISVFIFGAFCVLFGPDLLRAAIEPMRQEDDDGELDIDRPEPIEDEREYQVGVQAGGGLR